MHGYQSGKMRGSAYNPGTVLRGGTHSPALLILSGGDAFHQILVLPVRSNHNVVFLQDHLVHEALHEDVEVLLVVLQVRRLGPKRRRC